MAAPNPLWSQERRHSSALPKRIRRQRLNALKNPLKGRHELAPNPERLSGYNLQAWFTNKTTSVSNECSSQSAKDTTSDPRPLHTPKLVYLYCHHVYVQ